MCVSFASSYTLCGLSAQSELDFSPNCLVGSAEVILPMCGIWVTGQKAFSLIIEYFLLEYEHSNARAACEVCQVMAEREGFSFIKKETEKETLVGLLSVSLT